MLDAAQQKSLTVFTIHNDRWYADFPEERWWACVCAENEWQAFAIARDEYDGDDPLEGCPLAEFFCVELAVDTSHWREDLKPTHPQLIRDPEIQRLCGFRFEGEVECERCGFAAMNIHEYYVCPDCLICRKCGGCECDKFRPTSWPCAFGVDVG